MEGRRHRWGIGEPPIPKEGTCPDAAAPVVRVVLVTRVRELQDVCAGGHPCARFRGMPQPWQGT